MGDEDDDMPPHFTVEVLGATATEADILHVTITGADRKLGLQKPLDPIMMGEYCGMDCTFLSEMLTN